MCKTAIRITHFLRISVIDRSLTCIRMNQFLLTIILQFSSDCTRQRFRRHHKEQKYTIPTTGYQPYSFRAPAELWRQTSSTTLRTLQPQSSLPRTPRIYSRRKSVRLCPLRQLLHPNTQHQFLRKLFILPRAQLRRLFNLRRRERAMLALSRLDYTSLERRVRVL